MYPLRASKLVLRALGTMAVAAVLAPASALSQSQRATLRTIQELVPKAAVGFVSLPSINAVQTTLDMLHDEFGQEDDPPSLLEQLADQLDVEPDAIDTRRPFALALSLGEPGGPPLPTAIVPVVDEKHFDSGSDLFGSVRSTGKGYVSLSTLPDYVGGESFVDLDAKRLHEDVILSLDLHTIFELYGPWIQFFLANVVAEMEAESGDPATADMTRRGMEWTTRLIDTAKQLELALSIQQSGFALRSVLHTAPDGEPLIPVRHADRVFDLTRCLPKSYPAVSVVAADLSTFSDLSNMLNMASLSKPDESIPEEQREALLELIESSAELQRYVSGPMVFAGEIGERGVESIQILLPEDAGAFQEVFDRFLDTIAPLEVFGLKMERSEPQSLDGVEVHTYRFGFDPEWITIRRTPDAKNPIRNLGEITSRLLGGETAVVRFATVDGLVVSVVHPDEELMREVLQRLRSGTGDVPENLRRLAANHPVPPWLAADVDLRAFVVPVLEAVIAEEVLEDRDTYRAFLEGDPVPFALSGSLQDGVYRCEFTGNLRALADFIGALGEMHPQSEDDEREFRDG